MNCNLKELWKFIYNFFIFTCFVTFIVVLAFALLSFLQGKDEQSILCFLQNIKVLAVIFDLAFILTAIEVWGLDDLDDW